MGKKEALRYVLVGIITLSLFSVLLFLKGGFTGYAIFEDSGTDFDNGVYANTTYNGSDIILSTNNLTGTYTSQIFDATADASWNNLTYSSSKPIVEFLFAVDGAGDVYKSNDYGNSWSQTTDNYGRTTDTKELVADSDYIYIFTASNKEVWRSEDLGISWSIINNSFTTNGLRKGTYDENLKIIYISTGPGIVYSSNNFGISWTELGDINGGESEDPKGIDTNSSGAVFAVDGKGRVELSLDNGTTWTEQTDAYGGGSATDDLAVDSNSNIYILLNRQVYKSIDKGVTWNIINNSYSSDQDGLLMIIDGNNIFYIVDSSGDVYKSEDLGVTWNWISDFNGIATNDIKGLDDLSQYTNLSFQVKNCSQSDCADGTWQTIDLTNLNLQSRYFQYKITFTTPESSITPSLNSVNIDYSILNTPPTISITSPQDGTTYGYNESINLNFTSSDSEDNIDSCWYSIDNSQNTTITNCQNTTINISEGEHTLTVYINDTLGEETLDLVTFNIQVGAPTITLQSPINTYLNNANIQFNYTPTDIDLASCELWGDFTGQFIQNQTDNSPISGQINNFQLTLPDGTYLWNIKCNDSFGNSAFNGNKTFHIDTINPQLILNEPVGAKNSRSVTASWSVLDNSPVSCKYNIYRGNSVEITNTSLSCSANTTNFAVTVDADFTFNFYINDSAGNTNSTNSSFSVSTSTPVVPSSGGGGGGGGSILPKNQTGKLKTSTLSEIIAQQGDKKTLSINIENIGKVFLNNCKLSAKGEISSWIYSTQIQGIAPGENIDFIFNLNIPEGINPKDYSGELEVKCDEGINSQKLIISIPQGLQSIEIKKIQHTKKGLDISYNFDNTKLNIENINIEIWVINSDNIEVNRITDSFTPNKEITQRNIIMEIPQDTIGIHEVYFALSSDKENHVKQSIVLGESKTTGQAILGERGNKLAGYIVFFLMLGILIFFGIRGHFRKKPKTTSLKKNKKPAKNAKK